MKISIITINYNNKDGLQKTIDSVITQTFKNFEWIVIDGGSTDGSKELIEKYAQHITYWVSEPDKGIYNAMNKGILKATGDYLSFMNSGDTYYDNTTLDIVYNKMSESNADIYYGNSLYIYKDKERVFYTPPKLTLYDLYKGTILHQASFIKRELFQKQGYDETLKIVSDWKMWLVWILQDKEFKYIDLIISRFDAYGISTTNTNLVNEERNIVINEQLPLQVQHSLDQLNHFISIKNDYPIITEIYITVKKRWLNYYIIKKTISFITFINKFI